MRLTSVQMRNECSSHARHAHCGTSAETQYVCSGFEQRNFYQVCWNESTGFHFHRNLPSPSFSLQLFLNLFHLSSPPALLLGFVHLSFPFLPPGSSITRTKNSHGRKEDLRKIRIVRSRSSYNELDDTHVGRKIVGASRFAHVVDRDDVTSRGY